MIEFTQDYRVKPHGPEYARGSRHTLRASSEAHFVRNGVAVVVSAEVAAESVAQERAPVGESEPVAAESSPASLPAQASPATTAKRRGRPPRSSSLSTTHGDSAEPPTSSTPVTDDGGSST